MHTCTCFHYHSYSFFFPSLNATNPEADTKKLVSIYNDLFEAAFSVSLQCSGYNQLEVKLFKIGVLGEKKIKLFSQTFFFCDILR